MLSIFYLKYQDKFRGRKPSKRRRKRQKHTRAKHCVP